MTYCKFCGEATPMQATQHCDRCWELATRCGADPELAAIILADICVERGLAIAPGLVQALSSWLKRDCGNPNSNGCLSLLHRAARKVIVREDQQWQKNGTPRSSPGVLDASIGLTKVGSHEMSKDAVDDALARGSGHVVKRSESGSWEVFRREESAAGSE